MSHTEFLSMFMPIQNFACLAPVIHYLAQ